MARHQNLATQLVMILNALCGRIDRKGGSVRILDYKTGSVQSSRLKPKNWEAAFTDPDFSQAFQLMMYSWLYTKLNGTILDLKSGIISLRAPGNGPDMLEPLNNKQINPGVLEEFEEGLYNMLRTIFDPDTPFIQTDDEEQQDDPEFRHVQDLVHIVHNGESVRAEGDAGRQVAKNGTEAKASEQRNGKTGGNEDGDQLCKAHRSLRGSWIKDGGPAPGPQRNVLNEMTPRCV